MPTPLAKSWSWSVLLKTRGSATITIVPMIAPITEARPPTTATESTRIDSAGTK